MDMEYRRNSDADKAGTIHLPAYLRNRLPSFGYLREVERARRHMAMASNCYELALARVEIVRAVQDDGVLQLFAGNERRRRQLMEVSMMSPGVPLYEVMFDFCKKGGYEDLDKNPHLLHKYQFSPHVEWCHFTGDVDEWRRTGY
jgi:hypothetical protein